MALATAYSRALAGIEAPLVSVETHISNGLPGLAIVGLPEATVRESRERVRSAILNARLDFPARRITVNLAPAELPKSGGRYDLAIAVSILAASGQLPAERLGQYEFLGELALGGELRPVPGALCAALQARHSGRQLVVPHANGSQVALVGGCPSGSAGRIEQVLDLLVNETPLPPCVSPDQATNGTRPRPALPMIRGQFQARRALAIAAAGGHNLLMRGPPGTGKTLLAGVLHALLPDLEESQALELAAIRSVAGAAIDMGDLLRPPFRSPHHTATPAALVGGGSRAVPGEVSLAHNGVLFLDEFPEFGRAALEVLREPLEAGRITVSRANHRVCYPARFQLVAAMNPCPCGYHDDPSGKCRCAPQRIAAYLQKISGPLLDRIDLAVEVPRLSPAELCRLEPVTDWDVDLVRRVAACRAVQLQRAGKLNSGLDGEETERLCRPDRAGRRLLAAAARKLQLSVRGYHRVLRLARTLADLQDGATVSEENLLEALNYRLSEGPGRA